MTVKPLYDLRCPMCWVHGCLSLHGERDEYWCVACSKYSSTQAVLEANTDTTFSIPPRDFNFDTWYWGGSVQKSMREQIYEDPGRALKILVELGLLRQIVADWDVPIHFYDERCEGDQGDEVPWEDQVESRMFIVDLDKAKQVIEARKIGWKISADGDFEIKA